MKNMSMTKIRQKKKAICTVHLKIYTICNYRHNDGSPGRHENLWADNHLLKYEIKPFH